VRTDETDTLVYLGSAEMLDGAPDKAVVHLRLAVQLADDPALREEATWQLVNAMLLSNLVDESSSLLDNLAAGGGHRAGDARSLQESLPD
jgi:hypothetical protein